MSMPSSNWAAGAFQKTVTNVFYSRVLPTRRLRSRRRVQQISLESLEPRQMLSVNPASSGSGASSSNDSSNIAAFVSQNTIGILSTVPGSPTSVVAVRGNASLAVTWIAPASTGGSPITDYLVKYSSNNGSTWTNFVHPVSTVPSLTVTGLTNGTAYVIKVIAKNAVGISLPSANSAPATPATVPGSPTSVVAVSGSTSLAVTWTAPASTGGSTITDYLVKYSSDNGDPNTWTNFVHPLSIATACTVTGLTNGTSYVIKVIAKNAVGSSLPSANSAPVAPTFMSMVTVGNPGNAADTTGYGAVSYSYWIGKYDVTGSQYTAFLNAVGSTDNAGLYKTVMGTDTKVAQISRSGTAGTYTYAVLNSTGNRPITWVTWFDCARFSNWMSNGRPSGAQNSTTTENGAYNLNGAGNAVAKNATNPNTGSAPTYRIPLENEWYKAAYYTQGAIFSGYWTYATRSSAAPGTTIGSGDNQANYNNAIGHATDVGSFSGSGSFYGTFDQSGNVFQWNDLDGTAGSSRGFRGGSWGTSSYDNSSSVSSSNRHVEDPSYGWDQRGFRLASRIAPATVPGSPTAVVAVSGNDQLTVTWTAPAITGGSPITNYLVKYSSDNGSTWTNFVHPVSIATACTVTGLTNGTSYVIKVIAKNAVGSSLPSGNSAPITPELLAMSMVTVGNPGNAADAKTGSLYGAVSYSYQIGAYDVTGSQYTAFLNAVGSTDTYALYDSSMGTDTTVAQISRSGTAGTYAYAVMNSTGNRPISYVSWFDCARFSNWMSNGQPSGAQNSTTTENGAYKVNGATTGNAVAKNLTNPNTGSAPTFRITLENEWYKAAYYSPNYGGTSIGGYWTYATQRNTVPGTTIGSSANQANYNKAIGHSTDVGSFSGSGSFYGTFDQSGNVYQWNDLDGAAGSSRGLRGGSWNYGGSDGVSSSHRFDNNPSVGNDWIGFRLASPV